MKNWLKLLIPVVLGLAAAGVNFWAMEVGSSELYVQLAGPLKDGELIDGSNLQAVRIKFGGGGLKTAAVPYKERAALLKRPVTRALEQGDLVLWRDIGRTVPKPRLGGDEVAIDLALSDFNYDPSLLKVGSRVGFYVLKDEPPTTTGDGDSLAVTPVSVRPFDPKSTKGVLLGPVRIVSVGSRTDEERGLLEKDEVLGGPVNITVAVPLDGDSKKMTPLGDALILAKSNRPGDPGSIRSMVLYGSAEQ